MSSGKRHVSRQRADGDLAEACQQPGPYLSVDATQQTSVAGVFAAGDAASPMYNATFASAAGVKAGISAHRALVLDAEQRGMDRS